MEWSGHQDFRKFLMTMEGTDLEAEPVVVHMGAGK